MLRLRIFIIACLFFIGFGLHAQTSWKGTTSTSWSVATNWTNGVPTATVDAIIGDNNFTGTNQPATNVAGQCKSLTIGGGTKATTLIVKRNLTIYGNVTINSNGTINHTASAISLTGNWLNNGTYTKSTSKPNVIFSGISQTIGGTSTTTFNKLTINSGSMVTLTGNITASGRVIVTGVLYPGEWPTYKVTTVKLVVKNGGIVHVKAGTFAGNYDVTPTSAITLNIGATVEYSSSTVAQTIYGGVAYDNLNISGTTTKSLISSLTPLKANNASTGNINVNNGTLDLGAFTADRATTTVGGNILVVSGAKLRIGGTGATFPDNFNTVSLSLGSTVEYYGGNQTVDAQTYGNLNLISGTGAAIKTMPSSVDVLGNLTASISGGTTLAFTNGSGNVNISGNLTLNALTTYNGGSGTTTISGNIINAGTINGNTGTLEVDGPGKTISGAGAYNLNNFTVTDAVITASAPSIGVAGNFATVGSASFTHETGGTLTLTGASKTLSGTGITLANLTIGLGATIGSTSIHTITGNLTNNGTFNCTAGSTKLTGTAKAISGSGATTLYAVNVTGSITSTSNITIGNSLSVSGSCSASAGTTTFKNTSSLNGTANLFNVTISGTELRLATNANLGIAGTLSLTAGTINVTASTPNTITYNGGAQNVKGITYDNLILNNGGTKTADAAITIKRNLTISTGTTYNASGYTHNIYGDFNQSGTFTASTSTFIYNATSRATINGATTFNNLTLNNSAGVVLDLNSNVSVANLIVNTGYINTLANKITITSTRTGNGIILGTVTRTHSFSSGVDYAFEGPNTSIRFTGFVPAASITIKTVKGAIAGFPYGSAINRNYEVSCAGATFSNARLRFHYEDAELNGNAETAIVLWKYEFGTWNDKGKSGNNAFDNYVELSGLSNIQAEGKFTLAKDPGVVKWTGAYDTNWSDSRNWAVSKGSPSMPPSAFDIVELGSATATYQPTINSWITVRSIDFSSTQPITLSIGSLGSLNTGNINGTWSGSATHNINVGDGSLVVSGDFTLGDNSANHNTNLSVNTGSITVSGTINQQLGCSLVFTGSGALNIGEDYTLANGIVTPGTGTIKYNGDGSQEIAGINYYNLVVDKASGVAAGITSRCVIGNSINVLNGQLDVLATTEVLGDVLISSTGTLNGRSDSVYVAGNWNNAGTFIPSLGTISFNGTGSQNIGASAFNNILINKSSGTASLTGNVTASGNISIATGNLNLSTFTLNRVSVGGNFSMLPSTGLLISGASNFPTNFSSFTLDTTSTVTYNGTVIQTVGGGLAYGNLILSNGASNAKTLNGNIDVRGNLTINTGATFTTGANAIYLFGNWTNSGTFTPSTGSLIFSGWAKTITGNTTFNKVSVVGSYTVASADITINNKFQVSSTGSYAAGSGVHIVNGDMINSGSLSSTGTTTFSGNQVQTIQLLNAISSVSNGIINFNGTISPILNSNTSPTFANLNINNTGGVKASVPWQIYGDLTIGAGATFNSGNYIDTIRGNVTNNGTITSSGTLHFLPSTNVTIALGASKLSSTGTLRFGGTGLLTVTGTPTLVTDVVFSNRNAAGVTMPAGWTIAGDLAINNLAKLNAGSYTYNVLGSIECNGELDGGTSTFILKSAEAEISANTTTNFYHFTVFNGAILTINSDFNINGNLVNNGTIDATSTGSPRINGTGPSTISGSSSDLPGLIIAKTGATATLARNLTKVSDLSIVRGTFATAGYSITEEPVDKGSLSVEDYATLKLEGTSGLPSFTTVSLDTLSTVEYAGTNQTITSGNDYGNLTISTAGTKTANGSLNIVGDFTLANGTFIGGNFIDTLQGNWTMTSGTFTNTNTTIFCYGPFNQTLKSTGAFNNLTINKTENAVYDSTNITVNGTLNLIAGKIITGTNKIITPNGGSVSRTSGYVIGTMQKYIQTGNSTVNYELGDTGGYAPTILSFSGVASPGSIAIGSFAGDHTDIANSLINSNKSVNRRWVMSNSGVTFSSYGALFNYLASDVDSGSNTSNFYISKLNGGAWIVTSAGARTDTSTEAVGLNSIGEFVIGELYARAWDGGAFTNNWNDANNWNPDGEPGATEGAWIKTGVTPEISTIVTVDHLQVTNASAIVSLKTGGSLAVNGELNLANGKLELNSQTLTLNGTINATAAGTITGSSTANIVIGGTTGGNVGTLNFTANSPNNRVHNFTLNRTGADAEVLIGTNGLEVTNLVSIPNGILRSGDNLTLISNASGTARVGQLISPADLTGQVNVQRYIPAVIRRSRLISPSVAGFDFTQLIDDAFITGPGGITNGFDASTNNGSTVSTYQESTIGTRGWKGISNINNTLNPGQGITVFVRGDRTLASPDWYTPPFVSQNEVTYDFVGNINKGTISPTITYTNTAVADDDGWNLVGNPYPSPIDWNLVTKSNLSAFYYVFNPATNSYIADNGSINIASGQAFFVQATDDNPTITFNENNKVVTDVVGNFKTSAKPMQIEIRKDALTADFAWLNINNNASANYNPLEDAIKLTNAVVNLSFIGNDNVLQQYYTTPIGASADTFKLDLDAPTGSYTFTFSNLTSLPLNSGAYFIDKYNQNVVDLATTNTYTFAVAGGNTLTFGQRFIIVINNAVLPVKLVSFTGHKQQNNVVLNWHTANEINNKGFEIERMLLSNNTWQAIGFVAPAKGSTNNKYTYTDNEVNLSKSVYYRLKQIDLSGNITYSNIVVIGNEISTANAVSIYPNPASNIFNIELLSAENTSAQITITDITGQKIVSLNQDLQMGKNIIKHEGLKTGIYFVEVIASDRKTVLKLIIR